MTDNLAAPGSSTYKSNTMFVGDGTWDKTRNTFLLPNLMGFNFATMRYNGMGNRFKGLPEYHVLILGHGVLAAITFLGIVPLAIFLAKYGRDWPGGRVSFKLHVYLQILTVFLATVILTLGWFAVGPQRSLTNPHHGIGLAIYVLILFQFLYGTCMYRRERKRSVFPTKLPLTVWIHKLLGRSTALLAFVQIGLGLTLYGSPKKLFILYALAGFVLMVAYLGLEYHYKPRAGAAAPGGGQSEFYSDDGSYVSGSRTDVRPAPRREQHHWGRDLLAAGGVFGAYEWWKHRRDRRREEREGRYDEERYDDRQRPPPGRPPPIGPPPPGVGPPPPGPPMGPGPPPSRGAASQSRMSRESWDDEKYSEPPRHTWRNRILGATGAFAAYEGARAWWDRRRGRDEYSDEGSRYGSSALGGNHNIPSRTDVSRVEEGQAPGSPDTPRVNMAGIQPMTPTQTPLRDPRRPRVAGDTTPYDSRGSFEGGPPPTRPVSGDQTLRESIGAFGALAGFREWNRQRKERREADRMELRRRQELDHEQDFNRRNSSTYPRPIDANQRPPSEGNTLMTGPSGQDPNLGPDGTRSNLRPDTSHPPLPAEAGTVPSSSFSPSRQNVATEQGYSIRPPPPGAPPDAARGNGYGPSQFGSAQMPQGAVNPDPSRLVEDYTAVNAGSAYGVGPSALQNTTRETESLSPTRPAGSRTRLQKRGSTTSGSVSQLNSGVAGPSRAAGEDANSPPVSVKVKMANDGRTVTLRRLNEEEAAAERSARRQERRNRRRRGSSLSSGLEEDAAPGPRYRRNAPMRPSSGQPIANVPPPPPMSSSAGASQRRESELNLPPAPAVPQHSSPMSMNQGLSPPAAPGVGSPAGYGTDGGTDVSAFADNRRRRRAERARQQAAEGNKSVEFE